jgi:hypothetical protein
MKLVDKIFNSFFLLFLGVLELGVIGILYKSYQTVEDLKKSFPGQDHSDIFGPNYVDTMESGIIRTFCIISFFVLPVLAVGIIRFWKHQKQGLTISYYVLSGLYFVITIGFLWLLSTIHE